MTTKGPSNRFGNARGGSKGHATAHTGFAWAKGFNRTTLTDHFERHGSQVNVSSKESYAAHAVSFANTVDRKNNKSFVDKNGSTYKYNVVTNEFAVITKKGVVVTYYKPAAGYEYYKEQKKARGSHGRKK